MTQVVKERGPSFKRPLYRKKAYRRHIASQPCLACGYSLRNEQGYRTQAAHIRTGFFGASDKPDDWYCIPLCAEDANGCHAEFGKNERRFAANVLSKGIEELKAEAKANWQQWLSEAA